MTRKQPETTKTSIWRPKQAANDQETARNNENEHLGAETVSAASSEFDFPITIDGLINLFKYLGYLIYLEAMLGRRVPSSLSGYVIYRVYREEFSAGLHFNSLPAYQGLLKIYC